MKKGNLDHCIVKIPREVEKVDFKNPISLCRYCRAQAYVCNTVERLFVYQGSDGINTIWWVLLEAGGYVRSWESQFFTSSGTAHD